MLAYGDFAPGPVAHRQDPDYFVRGNPTVLKLQTPAAPLGLARDTDPIYQEFEKMRQMARPGEYAPRHPEDMDRCRALTLRVRTANPSSTPWS